MLHQKYSDLPNMEMCDLEAPHQRLEGQSLASTLNSPTTAKDREVFLPYMTPGEYAVINRDWRYICYGDQGEELYNLREDIGEQRNLVREESSNAEELTELWETIDAEMIDPIWRR